MTIEYTFYYSTDEGTYDTGARLEFDSEEEARPLDEYLENINIPWIELSFVGDCIEVVGASSEADSDFYRQYYIHLGKFEKVTGTELESRQTYEEYDLSLYKELSEVMNAEQ